MVMVLRIHFRIIIGRIRSCAFRARRAEAPHASCSHVPDLTTRAGGRRASKMRGSSPEEVL